MKRYQIEISASIPLFFGANSKAETIKMLNNIKGGGFTVVTTKTNTWEGNSPKSVANEMQLEIDYHCGN